MPKKILLADDSVTIQKVVSITLAHEDFDLTIVDNGSKAISKAKEIKPDVILLDVVMPDKDGYQVCQEIKGNADLKDIPIILLTGTFEPFDADRAAEVGADDFIKKPFESHTLINKVKEMAAKLRVSREKPVDISEVDIDFETPVEAQYGEKPAEKPTSADEATVTEDIETGWEVEGEDAGRPVMEHEGEDIWSVEEFEDITGGKGGAKSGDEVAGLSTERKAPLTEEKAPVKESAKEAPSREEAVSDEFFVREGKPSDVEVEDFELGEEISEDELEKFLEEETGDAEIAVQNTPEAEEISVSGADEEILISDEDAPSIGSEHRVAESFDKDMIVEDFEESSTETMEAAAQQSDDIFIEDSVDEGPIELEWEEEPVSEKTRTIATEKTEEEFETLIRRTTEEEMAEFSPKTDSAPDTGRKPATREFEVDLSSFDEEPLEEESGDGRPEPQTFDFEEFSEEIPSEREGPGKAPATGESMGSLDQKDVSIAVDKIVREVIEKVVWEVVPELAEELIKQEIKRLKGEKA
ncbi:MAG: response regulator [Deltaproteobacteria bacterium]|nr:response regulator [Candidatus Zymogenaceae bacterium]